MSENDKSNFMYYKFISKNDDGNTEEKKGRFIMKRLKIAQYIAVGATALSVIAAIVGTNTEVGNALMVFGVLGALVSYLLGGFRTAAEMASKAAGWAWDIFPFPLDFAMFIGVFILIIGVLVFLPIIPIRRAYKERL